MTSDSTTTIHSSSKKVDLNGTPVQTSPLTSKKPADDPVIKREYDWILVLLVIHLNLLSIYAIYLVFTKAMYTTILFSKFFLLFTFIASVNKKIFFIVLICTNYFATRRVFI